MKKILLLMSFVFLSGIFLHGQMDTIVRFNSNFKFKDGLYLSFEDFTANCPSIKAKYLLDKKGRPVTTNWSSNKNLYYEDNDTLREISFNDIWGFSENGRVYFGKQGRFKRLQIIGAICHVVLVEEIEDYTDNFYRNSFNSRPIVREVSNEYIIDFDSGEMQLFEKSFFEGILKNDPELYQEYRNLSSSKKQKSSMFHFLTRYNNAHPVYFSVSQCMSRIELANQPVKEE